MRAKKNGSMTPVGVMVVIAGAAWGAPEFVVEPLMPPPTAVGQHTTMGIGVGVVLGAEVKGNFAEVLDNQSGEVAMLHSSVAGGVVDAVAGIEWSVCRRVIRGRIYTRFEGVAVEDGDFCEALLFSSLTSPAPGLGRPIMPRFALTEPAEIRISWEASAAMTGAMSQTNLSLTVLDLDAVGPGFVILDVSHSVSIGDPEWSERGSVTVALEAGSYDLRASSSHQGTMNFPPFKAFDSAMAAHASVRFVVEIVGGGCGGDVTGDGAVDVDDLNAVLGAWGGTDPSGDADCSGLVDVDDLNRVLAAWTQACV